MKLQKVRTYTAGDHQVIDGERFINDLKFKIHKFNNRPKPDANNIVIFPMFSEFGCETLAVIYCLPSILRQYAGKYSIVMGWAGRAYFYRHLVDEYWELPEEHMWLREYCRAFHHVSRNLRHAEKDAKKFGDVLDISRIGNIAVFPALETCPVDGCGGKITRQASNQQKCDKCNTLFEEPGLFSDVQAAKSKAVWLPSPSLEKMEYVKKYLPDNAVGITARYRKTWGRNLEQIFYERLIYLLEDLGYNPVWLGEKVTSLPCPFKRITDFSITEDANDLETTLALVAQMKFTVQFWTASSRLAALVGTPYIIIESPDQIWGGGQEGARMNLMTRGHRKLVICHYKNVCKDHSSMLSLIDTAVCDIKNNDYDDIIGLVENKEYVKFMKDSCGGRIGGQSPLPQGEGLVST